MALIIPFLGNVNAKFVIAPAGLVKSIVFPTIDIPGAELPNSTNAGVPTKPPATEVKRTGIPDANGMIASDPVALIAQLTITNEQYQYTGYHLH